MEWVETTGRTVHEAKERALDQLGVAEDDAEFDVLDEPRPGLFGRMRGEARVRARVRPTQARQKVDRRDRKRKRDDAPDDTSAASAAVVTATSAASAASPAPRQRSRSSATKAAAATPDAASTNGAPRGGSSRTGSAQRAAAEQESTVSTVSAHEVGEAARRFMEELVTAFGLSGTVELVEDGDDLEVRVQGSDLGLLVGPRGTTLQAVQDLARVAAQRRLGDHDSRLRVDVGGYRERRREALGRFALQVAEEVRSSGSARSLEPMSSADRKIVHDALAEFGGVVTHSEGDDPQRRVVIVPADA